jgi:hypothetical protein
MTNTVRAIRPRELAHRHSAGIDVTLYWAEATNELSVVVVEDATGVYFELPAEPDKALDVFHHPYFYASRRSLYGRERAAA